MMKAWNKVENFIDSLSEWLGKIGWVIIFYVMAFGLFDVIMRYFFDSPSLWISTTIQYAMVLLACVSGAYALNSGSFVKLDIFYEKFPPKVKAIVDILTFSLTFLYLYVLITKGIEAAQASFMLKQETPTAVPIPLYHLKAIIPFAAFCVLLVAIKKLVIDVRIVLGYHQVDKVENN
ncbi:TRAP transporter small permease subunit [Ornithinibacillus halophilus]|uniref:TRAP-type mannitol/chloroaromatic compound transport system, small permease component n=1 Tax=Ornithinibacillus halophilus TaxID=930117 RepID=A0A1M5GS50_9BACI|nr:TRAP transporter small permease subunit [Ornithinibacillus halophilus]SHG06604.1 TRAP-type mannitol/chloroaromatic compound transport system, small permease component [Ornithinibacillus halophilus]